MRPLTISPHELRDNGLACGTRCAYAACCPSAAYYALRNQVDLYVTRDTPTAEMHETRRVLALMGAALSMCNPIASHWLHVHERQRVRSAVEATGPTVQDDPRACADHTAVCACYPCAYEQESRLILDISSPIVTNEDYPVNVTSPPTPEPAPIHDAKDTVTDAPKPNPNPPVNGFLDLFNGAQQKRK
ncbi:hypothetical protein CYMTET_2638 [Cymbomonas tetramitiformis]|uniref:Uncharacterized protein n=1 Tax=Cymbomonas tetramitiformis TaxID=36881 RepID=A0AAE0LMB3_9CHLO|nr:hypothetical protein CYMTET_2638 [Cymbomonas tetramitiformis]